MGNRRAAPVEHTAPASATVADLPTRTPTLARQQTNSKKRQRQQPNASASANHLPTRTPTHQQTNKKRQRQQPTALANTNGIQRPPQRQRKRRGSGSRKPEVIVLSDESEPESEPAAASSRPAEPTSSRNSSMSQFESRDYFTVLGLSRSATDADIRKAYRKLAVQWHPDKNRENPKAEEYFKRIAEAYEVLSDPEKRRQYERSGTQGGGGEDDTFSGFAFHSGGFSSRHARDIFEAFFGGGHDPFDTPFFRDGRDPFDTPFFRGAGVSGRSGRRQPAMDPFDDFDDAFGFGFGFPSMGRGGSPFRHSSRGMNGSVMAGNMRSFSSQTVSSSTSTDRHGRVVTTTTTTTMTPDGRAETVTETFRDGALLSSSSSNSRLAGAGRMQLDHRGARQLS